MQCYVNFSYHTASPVKASMYTGQSKGVRNASLHVACPGGQCLWKGCIRLRIKYPGEEV